jgi:hypothetical protein
MRSCTQRRLWRWSCMDARRVESVTARPIPVPYGPAALSAVRSCHVSRKSQSSPSDSRELARAGAQVRLTLTRPRAKPAML